MKKATISHVLRNLRLIYSFDRLFYRWQKWKNHRSNHEFIISNPDIALPPDYLIYESFQLNYSKYYHGGIESAEWIIKNISKYTEITNMNILDWGCGPGRIIRHMPLLLNSGCNFYGTDLNKESIHWCTLNLPQIHFNHNTIEARLPYPDGHFGIIYGISIFTHLSEDKHFEWFNELYRVLDNNGILFLTTQGDQHKVKLTRRELARYNKGQLVVRGKVREGHRTYSSFHPADFMKKLLIHVEILEHSAIESNGKWIPQDVWIVRKHSD